MRESYFNSFLFIFQVLAMNNEGIVNIRIKTGPSRITKIKNCLDIDEEKSVSSKSKHEKNIKRKFI